MTTRVEVAIIGAGFAGIGMALALLRDGRDAGSLAPLRRNDYNHQTVQPPAVDRLLPGEPLPQSKLRRIREALAARPEG